MARIAGVDLPRDKHIGIALTYIYGIGRSSAQRICEEAGVPANSKTFNLDEDEVSRLRDVIERTARVEGDLRRETSQNIKMLMDIGCYRGLRHRRGLPVRGQRTRSNARTRKGPRRTVANKKKPAAKK
jgi:small subunit ribosomal protein S13